MSAPQPVVTLHVGTPKSGTTSLQNILARNRERLRRHGYLYPGENAGHFLESLSLRGSGFRGHSFPAAEGAWDRVVADVLAHDGPALLSHETFGGARPRVVEQAVRSFPGRTVRVVITCRDLGRQLPAVWQEGVKNGDTDSYAEFLATAFAQRDGDRAVAGAWRGQDLASMASRWAQGVGAENVVLVTVPPSGSDRDLLWQRFRSATGLPEADYAVPPKARNESLGTVETELLRRVVARLPEDLPHPVFARQVKRRLAQRRLAGERVGGSLGVPEDYRARTAEVTEEVVAALRAGGYPVVGDLEDLRAAPPEGTDPGLVADAALLDRALDLLVPLVLGDRPGPGPDARTAGEADPAEDH